MAGHILDVRKVRESETEVEYDLSLDVDIVQMAWAAVWRKAGRPKPPTPQTVWPDKATHIG